MVDKNQKNHKKSAGWDNVSGWYGDLVGEAGHYYHQNVILPNILKMLDLKSGDRLLDIGCGQGILARAINKDISYLGIDASKKLIDSAKQFSKNENSKFLTVDITKTLPNLKSDFTHASAILSLQDIGSLSEVMQNIKKLLVPNGLFICVIKHPCFRVPRRSGWGVNEKGGEQYRWVSAYATSMKIPIIVHPGQGSRSPTTAHFHDSLSQFASHIFKAGFVIVALEEWYSDKKSFGKNKAREDKSRSEIPLFMGIGARVSK